MNTGKFDKDKIDEMVAREKRVNISVALFARYKCDLLCRYLGSVGMQVEKFTESDIENSLSFDKFNLVIVDLPEDPKSIPAFIRKVYAFSYPAPVLVVCSEYNAGAAVAALEAGAVGCISHLVSYDIILSQIRALIRHNNTIARNVSNVSVGAVLNFGEFSINKLLGRLYYRGKHIPMTPDSVAILAILVENLDNIVSTNTICMKVYGTTGTKPIAKLRQQMTYLRNTLCMDPTVELLNQYNIGYGVSVISKY